MNKYYFTNNSIYVEISILKGKLFYMANKPKVKLTFYNTTTEICSIIFNSIEELLSFTYEIGFVLIDYVYESTKDLLPISIYNTVPNEYGVSLNVTLNYKYFINTPSEDDDIIQFSIYGLDDLNNKRTILVFMELKEEDIEYFVAFIYNYLENNGINVVEEMKKITKMNEDRILHEKYKNEYKPII